MILGKNHFQNNDKRAKLKDKHCGMTRNVKKWQRRGGASTAKQGCTKSVTCLI